MEKYPHPTWIEIDVAQFKNNLMTIRKHIGKSRFCLPVKANAYGHGLIGIAKAAAGLVDCLAVSCLQEGMMLRNAGISAPILVLGAIHEDQVDDLIGFNLEFSISSQFKADLVAKKSRGKCRIHLEVETGMQRTGVRCSTALQLIQHLKTLSCFDIAGVYSHLATSDTPNNPTALRQIKDFQELVNLPPFQGLTAHLANSGGVENYPESHLDMVRPGLMVYGYSSLSSLSPCFSLKSKVSYFKVVPQGAGISYGHTYITQKKTRIVTVPMEWFSLLGRRI